MSLPAHKATAHALLPEQGTRLLGGVPSEMVPLVLVQLLEETRTLLYIAIDDATAARHAEGLRFFAPTVEVMTLPGWDCLPYDRVSPSAALVAERLATLARMAEKPTGPRVVIATVSAMLQRCIPRQRISTQVFTARTGQTLSLPNLQAYLTANGYFRAETVREAGEYAIRGGLIDLFPPGSDQPLRLDLFGDTVEAIRTFDPLTQRSLEARPHLKLLPVSECALDEDGIARFRQRYREEFGAILDDDPLYAAVSEGRRHGGMEHWLPLFFDGLDTVFDYLPAIPIVLDAQTEEAIDARLAQIADFFLARVEMQSIEKKAQQGAPYKPLKPEFLYLQRTDWERAGQLRSVLQLSAFTAPDALDMGGRRGRNFADSRAKASQNLLNDVVEHIETNRKEGRTVLLASYTLGSRDRLLAMLKEHGEADVVPAGSWQEALATQQIPAIVLPLDHGFETANLVVLTEPDIFGERLARPQKKRRVAENFIGEVSSLQPGDLIIHVDHGLGRYNGLETVSVGGAPHDCLKLIYADGDRLFVPVENIDVLTRYGPEDAAAQLDKLGGVAWQGRKARVKKRLRDMAEALLKIAAERALRKGHQISPPEGLYAEFCARFPYAETEDQQNAIEEIITDLGSGRPMDRLICGDVGFGKTEVAMRAAFLAAAAGDQVAIITPTTLLSRQHTKNFTTRFAGLPLRIAQLSRLVGTKEAAATKKELAEGMVDIVIGTHALLAKSLTFKNLGLVIVDEEQHFGVKQKERLKELRHEVHVLTLTATPIPRTLQLALAGVREMSLITTPPVDRLAVRTYVLPFDPVVVREALMREHFRGGQSFYVCPRIEDQPKLAEQLRDLVPDLKVVVANGQMGAEALENVMTDFYSGKYDVLLATNIIESGLDIPNANTIIMHRADMFGLAQLYQLRGRVGRGKTRGYAYLTYPPRTVLAQTAQKRLEVMTTLDSLGAGFTLASHDMDIRGAGNILGEEQSGHIREVGVELYQHMLEEAVSEARQRKKGEKPEAEDPHSWQPQINLGIPVLIPESYVGELSVRLGLYQRLADLQGSEAIDSLAAELVDRFGKMPPEVENLLDVLAIKQLCRAAHIEKYDAGPKGAMVSFRGNTHPNPAKLVEYLSRQGGAMKLRPDHKLVALRPWDDSKLRLSGSKKLLQDLAALAS